MRPALILVFAFLTAFFSPASAVSAKTIYDFQASRINGKSQNLSEYRGKVLLIVNTASRCGFTPQYAALQKLYEQYHDRGFEVLAFPANNFGSQEPGSNSEIREFCDLRFKTKFPLFEKISVKGKDIHPLFAYLTRESEYSGSIKWNFSKFLIDREGKVIGRFAPTADPLSDKVVKAVEKALA